MHINFEYTSFGLASAVHTGDTEELCRLQWEWDREKCKKVLHSYKRLMIKSSGIIKDTLRMHSTWRYRLQHATRFSVLFSRFLFMAFVRWRLDSVRHRASQRRKLMVSIRATFVHLHYVNADGNDTVCREKWRWCREMNLRFLIIPIEHCHHFYTRRRAVQQWIKWNEIVTPTDTIHLFISRLI